MRVRAPACRCLAAATRCHQACPHTPARHRAQSSIKNVGAGSQPTRPQQQADGRQPLYHMHTLPPAGHAHRSAPCPNAKTNAAHFISVGMQANTAVVQQCSSALLPISPHDTRQGHWKGGQRKINGRECAPCALCLHYETTHTSSPACPPLPAGPNTGGQVRARALPAHPHRPIACCPTRPPGPRRSAC